MQETYLAHFGIKGMKWGVRRYQNQDGSLTTSGKARYKDIKEYQKQTYKKAYDNIYKKENEKNQAKIKDLEKQASELRKKYNFDWDDGGGGKTKADEKAGRKYYTLLEKMEKYEYAAEDTAHKRATDVSRRAMIEKYGQQRINRFDAQTVRRGAAQCLGVTAALAAIPASILAYTIVKY